MATTGPNHASSAAESGSGNSWTNLANAVTDDGSAATASAGMGFDPKKLELTDCGTFADIGDEDDVTDVQIEPKCQDGVSSNHATWNHAQLVVGDATVGTARNPAQSLNETYAYETISYSTAAAGLNYALTGAEANAAGFGAQLGFTGGISPLTVSVDAMRITLTYTAAGEGTTAKNLTLLGVGCLNGLAALPWVGQWLRNAGMEMLLAVGLLRKTTAYGRVVNCG